MKLILATLLASQASALKLSASFDLWYDNSKVEVEITTKGKGPACLEPTWATFHWKSIIGDGRVVENTRERFSEG